MGVTVITVIINGLGFFLKDKLMSFKHQDHIKFPESVPFLTIYDDLLETKVCMYLSVLGNVPAWSPVPPLPWNHHSSRERCSQKVLSWHGYGKKSATSLTFLSNFDYITEKPGHMLFQMFGLVEDELLRNTSQVFWAKLRM